MSIFNSSAPRRPAAAVQYVTSRGEKGAKGDPGPPGDPLALVADVEDGQVLAKSGDGVVGVEVATPADVAEVAAEVALKANQADVTAALSSVASKTEVQARLIGGVRSTVDGSLRPTRGLYALEDPARPGEIVDLVLGDVA